MQKIDSGAQLTIGSYTLQERELTKENQNNIHYISVMAKDYIGISNYPICEIRELPNWSGVIHVVNSKEAQKLIQAFHRYGPRTNSGGKLCPFQSGNIGSRLSHLSGENNLTTLPEGESEIHRKAVHSFFTKKKLESLENTWALITQNWLEAQVKFDSVLLFDAALHLIGRCLIQGMLGYEECSKEDVNLNVEFWRELFAPIKSDLKSGKEFLIEGEPGLLSGVLNLLGNSYELIGKGYSYFVESNQLTILAEKIYKGTILHDGSFCFHLNNKKFSKDVILENIKGMLLAGQETVGYLLGFILYEYAKAPKLQHKNADDFDTIHATYLEALRLYSVGGVVREAGIDMVLSYPDSSGEKKEHYIRKGDTIGCVPFNLGHTDEWKDAEVFNPERADLFRVNEISHFGSGPHACIGKKAAEREIFTILKEVLSTVTLSTIETLPELVSTFTIRPMHDINVAFRQK